MNSSNEMSFIDHLEELRWNIIRSLVAIMIMACVCFIFKEFIFDVIIFGPKKLSFPTYKFLCNAATFVNIETNFCGEEFPFVIQNRTMAGQFSAHIWTSIIGGFIISFPYVIYELWKFISPGMHENERKRSRGFIFISSLLFFTGVLFGYYVVTPFSINFLGSYQVSKEVLNEIDLSSFIGLVRSSSLACGIVFELPIIMYFLTKVGLVTPDILIRYRKYALIAVLILAAIITPPDVASQIIVAIPILILYQISISISRFVIKKDLKKSK
jgi:sec-independent protein translocase protein TatC